MVDVKDANTFVQDTTTLQNERRHTYHYVDQPAAGPGTAVKGTCVLLHGFPDLWLAGGTPSAARNTAGTALTRRIRCRYGWRYQIKALSSRGYRVICPSQLGYAGSSQPDDLQAYTYKNLAEDLNELLDVLGAGDQILLFGHDWYAASCLSVLAALRTARSNNTLRAQGRSLGMALCQLLSTACAGHSYVCDALCGAAPARSCLTASPARRVCTPYMPPAQPGDTWTPPDRLVHTRLPNFGYQLFFASDEGRTLMQRNVSF